MFEFLSSLFKRFGQKSDQRSKISFHITKEEAVLLHNKCVQLGLDSRAEVVRLSIVQLFDAHNRKRVIDWELSKATVTEMVLCEFEASDEAIGSLRALKRQLRLESPAEVIRVAINNFCRSDTVV